MNKYITVLDFEIARIFQYKEESYKRMDELLTKLAKKNGTTKY